MLSVRILNMSKEISAVRDDLRREIRQELKDFRDSFESELRKELREIKSSISFINQAYEELKGQIAIDLTENKDLKTANARLLETCSALRKEVKAHEIRIASCEQYSRNANIEVKGIPSEENKNLGSILQKTGEQIEEPILKADVAICHRVPVPHSTVNNNVIVQFTRRMKRNEVLNKARKHRLTCRDLGHLAPLRP